MAAAIANSVVVVLINLIALPIYLRFLGVEAYGLIGLYATLFAVSQILDMGLAPTISREIAHDSETGQRRRSASLLRSLGLIYLGVAGCIAVCFAALAPMSAEHWLTANTLPPSTVTQAVFLMGLNLACRWPIGLYHGALVGAQRLAHSAATGMVINICAACVSIAVLAFIERSIQAFFIVQAGFGLLHALVLRTLAWRSMGERDAPFATGDLRRIAPFSLWMFGTATTSLVFTQLDKALLSRLIDLESFGYYMIAVLLASGLSVLTGPAHSILYPRFTAFFSRDDRAGLAVFYEDASRIYAAAIFSIALALVLHARSIVELWTGLPDTALRVAPLVVLLASGSTLNGIMFFPYTLQLAAGQPSIPFKINLVLLLLAFPTIIVLAFRYGAVGGALSWAMLCTFALLAGTYVTGRKVASFAGFNWLLRDIAVPGLIALVPALLALWASKSLLLNLWAEVLVAALAACIGIAVGALYSAFVRQRVAAFLSASRRQCLS